MLSKISGFIYEKASLRIILVGIVLIALINLIIFPYLPAMFEVSISLSSILDLQFGFRNDFVHRLLNMLGEQGRKAYLFFSLFVDMPYGLIYGLTYAFLLAYVLRKKNFKHLHFIVLFPLFITFFDWIENAGIIYLLIHPFTYNEKWIPLFSLANQAKWVFAGVTLLAFLLILIAPDKRN